MDNLYYIVITNLIIFLSFVTFIVLVTVHVVKKQTPKIFSCIIFLLCFVGMYLFIPSKYLFLGYAFQSPNYLNKAIKLSINPYEKRLAYLYLGDIYNLDIHKYGIKDGNKAIYYYEKAIQNEYKKFPIETHILTMLYSLKGDYDKTIEISTLIHHKKCMPLRNAYILQDEYENALTTFRDNDDNLDNFLKADLYKKLGMNKEAKETLDSAQITFETRLDAMKEKSKQMEYSAQAERYKTVEAYKDWLKEQAAEYNF